mgnify:CR=1 FL=1
MEAIAAVGELVHMHAVPIFGCAGSGTVCMRAWYQGCWYSVENDYLDKHEYFQTMRVQ